MTQQRKGEHANNPVPPVQTKVSGPDETRGTNPIPPKPQAPPPKPQK